jgi:FkbM family methyltransferase
MSKLDAARFILHCQNWHEIALPIATHQTPARVTMKNGSRFVSHSIYWADMYGIFLQEAYTPSYLPIEKNDIVVDIGANIGVFTVYAASKTQSLVYAVEPFFDNFTALEQNIRANRLKNVIPLRFAVSNTSGTELLVHEEESQHHQLKKVATSSRAKYVEVPSITLQDLMDNHQIQQIDFLKLDCEGAEGLILTSTSGRYLRNIRKIAMEFHDELSLLTHKQIQNLLEKEGFATRIAWNGKPQLGLLHAWRE